MQKSLLLVLINFLIVINCFSQSAEKTRYFEKSKSQKTAAWLLVSGGTLCFIIDAAVGLNDLNQGLANIGSGKQTHNYKGLETTLLIAGVASCLGSIPLFVAGSRNKHKAASIAIKYEQATYLRSSAMTYKPIPAVCLKIGL